MQRSSRAPDPRRQRIEELLRHTVSDGTRQFYADGRRVLDGEAELESATNVLFHCAREIESAVRGVFREVVLTDDDRAQLQKAMAAENTRRARKGNGALLREPTHASQVRAIVARLETPARAELEEAWLAFARSSGKSRTGIGLAGLAHRPGLRPARAMAAQHRATWRAFEELLLALLPHLEQRVIEILARTRALAMINSPNDDHVEELERLPHTYVVRDEFVRDAGPSWLDSLDAAGFFGHPEEAFTRDAVTGTPLLQQWQAGAYLARVGVLPGHQEKFVEIATRVQWPHEPAALELLRVASTLALPLRSRYAVRLATWVREAESLTFGSGDVAQFAAGLAAEGDTNGAIAVIEELLHLDRDPRADNGLSRDSRARLDAYHYDHALEAVIPVLVERAPRSGFDMSLRLLVAALEATEPSDNVARKSDWSRTWRPSLPHATRHGHDHVNALVDAVRDTAVAAAATEEGLEHVTMALDEAQWTICRRLSLYVAEQVESR